jgi:putative glutamine amidotransferase
MSMSKPLPLVGIPANYALDDGRAGHRVGASYIDAVFEVSGCMAVLVPACGEKHDFGTLIDRLDGLFLTGGAPNVEPKNYGGPPSRPGTLHDPNRDATVLPLIRRAVEAGLPLFAVCLGIQEVNVALGGTLHQLVHEVPGKNEHRMDRTLPPGERGVPRHPVFPTPGGLLHRLAEGAGSVMVNSLHAQAVDRIADSLIVEGVSDDGVVEAVGMPGAKAFMLAVQWHPESRGALEWPLSQAMFQAFGDACRARRDARDTAPRDARDTAPRATRAA